MKTQIGEFIRLAVQVHKLCINGCLEKKNTAYFDIGGDYRMSWFGDNENKYYLLAILDKYRQMIEFNSIANTVTLSIHADEYILSVCNDALNSALADGAIERHVNLITPDKDVLVKIRELENKILKLRAKL